MAFTPIISVLPAPQQRLWPELAEVPKQFTLYGGTAIALHLGHRESIDFDFFGSNSFDPDILYREIPFLLGATILGKDSGTLHCRVDRDGPIKVSFLAYPELGELEPPHVVADNGLRVAGLLDLAATKAAVVQKRAEIKDYVDLDAIVSSTEIDLSTALAAGEALWGEAFHAESTLKALSYYADGDLRDLAPEIRDRLVQAVAEVDLDQLPEIEGFERGRDGWGLDL